MENTKIKLEVGKRYLLFIHGCSTEQYFEALVLEISPSGKRVKLRFPLDGNKEGWRKIATFGVQEELRSKPKKA